MDSPKIERVTPAAALPGGEVTIHGRGLAPNHRLPAVSFGETPASVLVASDDFVVATVPDNVAAKTVRVRTADGESAPAAVELGVPIADNLHPVANPAVDADGNIYVTFSGRRGQRVPISLYRIDPQFDVKPLLSDLMNATGLALDSNHRLYVSSRHEGIVYRVENSAKKVYAEGMGVATGLAFDADDNLYVGDRSGTIFKIERDRQIFVFATLEPSVAAYHLAFGPDGFLYVSGPTTSSHDCVYRISGSGQVEIFYRGLGRPQGLAFDSQGNLLVAASLKGRRGVVQLTPDGEAALAIAGTQLVGLAFAPPPRGGLVLATGSALFHLNWPGAGFSVRGG